METMACGWDAHGGWGMALRWGQMCHPHGLGEASAGAHAALRYYGLLFQR